MCVHRLCLATLMYLLVYRVFGLILFGILVNATWHIDTHTQPHSAVQLKMVRSKFGCMFRHLLLPPPPTCAARVATTLLQNHPSQNVRTIGAALGCCNKFTIHIILVCMQRRNIYNLWPWTCTPAYDWLQMKWMLQRWLHSTASRLTISLQTRQNSGMCRRASLAYTFHLNVDDDYLEKIIAFWRIPTFSSIQHHNLISSCKLSRDTQESKSRKLKCAQLWFVVHKTCSLITDCTWAPIYWKSLLNHPPIWCTHPTIVHTANNKKKKNVCKQQQT